MFAHAQPPVCLEINNLLTYLHVCIFVVVYGPWLFPIIPEIDCAVFGQLGQVSKVKSMPVPLRDVVESKCRNVGCIFTASMENSGSTGTCSLRMESLK